MYCFKWKTLKRYQKRTLKAWVSVSELKVPKIEYLCSPNLSFKDSVQLLLFEILTVFKVLC